MKGFLKNCMFCDDTLPPLGQRGRGEHIVPEYLMGSWRTKDVCAACNSYFGAHVDHLALEERTIVDAIFQLDLPDLKARVLDRAAAKTIDADTGRSLRVKTKRGKIKIVRQELNGVVDHDEADAFDAVLRSALRRPPPGCTEADVVSEIERLQAAYRTIQPGELVASDSLGRAFRKSRARTTYELKVTPNAATRLIAKIVYEVAFLFLSIERLQAYWRSLRALAAHARYAQAVDEYTLFERPRFPGETYDPTQARHGHLITCSYYEAVATIDVSLFALANYRVLLTSPPDGSTAPYGSPTHAGRRVEHARIVMTFEPGAKMEKLVLLFLEGEDEPFRVVATDRA